MRTVWVKVGNTLHQTVEGHQEILQTPENKVYNLCFNGQTGEIYLEEVADKFEFPFKVYGLQTPFIEHVITTYENTNTNLGILLDGKKGTGKSVTAKILAMRFNKPIIIIGSPFPGLQDFISKFSCECVFFLDEFEKTFGNNRSNDDGSTSMLLSVMDGAYNTVCRQVFLLTMNNTYIDSNFLGRPSRVRYHKTFGNLEPDVISEYIDDNLIDKSRMQDVLELVDSLELSTIDTLKAIVMDFNLHPGVSVETVREYLNLEFASYRYRYKCLVLSRRDIVPEAQAFEMMKERLTHVGEKYIDEDGDECEHTQEDFEIYDQYYSTSRNLYSFIRGEYFNNATVLRGYEPVNQTMILENSRTGQRYYCVIDNPSDRPSLYGSNLIPMDE